MGAHGAIGADTQAAAFPTSPPPPRAAGAAPPASSAVTHGRGCNGASGTRPGGHIVRRLALCIVIALSLAVCGAAATPAVTATADTDASKAAIVAEVPAALTARAPSVTSEATRLNPPHRLQWLLQAPQSACSWYLRPLNAKIHAWCDPEFIGPSSGWLGPVLPPHGGG